MIKPRLYGERHGDSSGSRASRSVRILPGVSALGVAVFLVGCGKPLVVAAGPAAARPGAPSAGSPDAGASADTFVLPPSAPPALPCAGCGPGQTCSEQICVDDCRSDRAFPCAAPSTCDFLSGRCVPPEARCVLTGTPAVCGTSEFPPRCGPGSRCDSGSACVPDAGCQRVICDASNFCRGADCPQLGGGGVQDVALDPLGEVAAGTAGGVTPRATVKADGLCGLTVT